MNFIAPLVEGFPGGGGLRARETKRRRRSHIDYDTRGGPAAKSSEPSSFPSSTIADVLDGRNLAARLYRGCGCGFSCLGGGVLSGLEPVTNADCDRSGRLDGMRGENRSAGACGYTWDRREGTHGD